MITLTIILFCLREWREGETEERELKEKGLKSRDEAASDAEDRIAWKQRSNSSIFH